MVVAVGPAVAQEAPLLVNISGVQDELRDNIEAHLSIFAASKNKDSRRGLTEKAIRRLHAAATAEIEEALHPFGFYTPDVESALHFDDGSWLADYAISPGPPTRLREVSIELKGEGRDERRLRQLVAEASRGDLAPGERLSHSAYEDLKGSLRSDAYALGYLEGSYQRSRIEVHPEQRAADLHLLFDTGPRFRFGTITVEQDILSEAFMDKFVTIEAGEPFEPRKLTNLQLALTESPYFSQAEVNIQRERAENQQVPVRITATPTRARRYETSVGYGTDTGPRGGAGVLWRHINRHGHQFRTDIRLSAIQSTLASQYKIPIGDVSSEFLDFIGDAERRTVNDVDATSYAVGTSLNENRWGGRRRLSLMLENEDWGFSGTPDEEATLLVPGFEYQRIVADNLLFTRAGYSARIMISGGSEYLLSDATFLQARASGRYVAPLGESGRLLMRGEYGATATDDFGRLPPSRRFYNGGAQSVRGYGFDELSPRDEQRNLVGGRFLGTASVEVDYLVFGDFGLALFVDAGNASNDADIDWKTAAGVGLRYKTPVGMFRIDLAYPFDDPDSSFAFHVSFGPDLQ